jgi:hypothetical protein
VQGVHSCHSCSTVLEILAWAVKQEKKIKIIQIEGAQVISDWKISVSVHRK